MTTPTPEQFLGTPSTEDEEDELPPGFPAAPREVVENGTIGPYLLAPGASAPYDPSRPASEQMEELVQKASWNVEPGQFIGWEPPTDLAPFIQQIAANVRLLTEHITNQSAPAPSINVYEEFGARAANIARGLVDDFTPADLGEAEIADDFTPADLGEAEIAGVSMVPVTAHDTLLVNIQIMQEQLADLEAEKQTLTELVDEIRAIVKPSSSKVSLEVKAAIERWANPLSATTEPPAAEPAPEPVNTEAGTHTRTATGNDGDPDYCLECSNAAQDWVQWPCLPMSVPPAAVDPAEVPAPLYPAGDPPAGPPAATDHVEAWRAYAREVQPEKKWEGMNRSQIRTALGIAQPVAGS